MTSPRTRLAALAAEHELDPESHAALGALLGALAAPEAPTSVHRPGQAVDVHLADSLAALAVPRLREARDVCDLGSGAGLPGLALAAALPLASFALVESNARKCAFIRATAHDMALENVRVVASRAEEWRDGLGTQDFACARALAPLAVLVEYAAPLLRIGGTLVAWKGEAASAEAADGAAAAGVLGCEPAGVLRVTPFAGSDRRTLHLFRKVDETPARYPRRPGMAVKRPITGVTGA